MASGASSLESNGSNESISHSYVSNERHNTAQIPTIPIPIEYDVLSPSQCYDKTSYTVKAHGAHVMSGPYEPLGQYDVLSKQTTESIKQQCEINQLRRQHTETSRRCDHVMKELEYVRGQHRAAMNQLEVSAQEASSLRGKYNDLLNDNQRLEREVQHLQQSGNPEGSPDLMHTLRKYEALKEEFECYQKRYEDLIEKHNTTLEKFQIIQDENNRLKTQCHDLTQERNSVIRERNALKQQVASMVRQWETRSERADIKRLTDERNAAMHEYTLVMSERDTVHKEMEKLADERQAALKRVAALEAALQAAREEQRATALQAESLRREIESALVERDRAIKECSDLKTPNTNTLGKSRQDNSAYHHLGLASGGGNDGFLNGQHSNDPSMDKLQGLVGMSSDSADAERAESLENNPELERLRKQLDRMQAELADAVREAEVSADGYHYHRGCGVPEPAHKESLENNPELERLRKQLDRMQAELADAVREAEVSADGYHYHRGCGVPEPAHKESLENNPELERLRKQLDRMQAELADAVREAEVSADGYHYHRGCGVPEPAHKESLENNPELERLRKQLDRMQAELADAVREAEVSADGYHYHRGCGVPEPAHKESLENNPELERLRKQLDRMQAELADAVREAEVSADGYHYHRGCGVPEPAHKESLENNPELERLRKQLDRMQAELADAVREAEVSKRRRDWAFSERDKLLQERESVKALCNRLRKERDQMVGELADARRHGGGKHSEAAKDVKNDYEWDLIDVELSGLSKDGDLGFELSGGREDPYYPNDCSIYVTAVKKGSPVEGKIKVLDRVTEACGVSVWTSGRAADAALRTQLARGEVRLRLQRARAVRVSLLLADARGLLLHHGIFISKITTNSAAAKDGNIYVGDRVVSINNRSLEGVKSVSEAMALLNENQYDVMLTVLRPLYPCCDTRDRFSVYEHSYSDGKMVNICSQTEESYGQFVPPPDSKVHIEHGMADFDRRYVYHLAAGSQGKIQERGAWDMIRGKIEAVTGRSKSKDKQNKVPESDAIAELDSVIDSYHGKTIKETSSVLKRSRRKNKESHNDAKNGGTWPKARANFILEENSTGTIVQPRSRKERPPLSILLSPPTKLPPEPQRSNTNRNSNPIPLGHAPLTQVTTPARHSVYKSIESSPAIEHFPKPAPLTVHNPFASPNSMNFEKIRTLEKDKMSISDYSDHDITPNRLSLVLNPSDDSLDYQPVTRNRTKSPHSLDFMVNKGPSSLDFVTRKSPSSIEHSMKNHPGKDLLEQYYSSKKSSSPKTVNKYPSDSDSFGPDSLNSNPNYPMTGTLPTQSRLQSQYHYRGPFVNSHPHTSRYPHLVSPTNIPQSQSGESIGTSYDMHSFTSHTHNMSDLQPVPRTTRVGDYHHTYEGGTFPRKKENQRFRIPSNPSVTSKNSAGKLSTGSIERSSERNSPMPTFHVEVLSPGRGAKQLAHKGTRNSMPEYCGMSLDKPLPGELRRVHIDKSQQPLGIQIYCPSGGGVFVSTVNDNSLARQVGLQIGDQLLEVCGINMRSATYQLAARVLRQIGNSITMLVQYSPDKYKDEVEVTGSSSSGESSHDEEVSLSGSPTPRNSPGPQQSIRMETPSNEVATLSRSGNKDLPRFLLIEMRNCSDLGISLVGGNAVGIFVHSVHIDSPAHIAGLRTGDQILEYNNVDLRRATAEQAALELAKPADKVSVLVRHDLQQYHDVKDKPGDAFYIRAGFDRGNKFTATGMDTLDEYPLWFRKDEVLFVDNTLYNGAPGLWRAWQLDCKGAKQRWGTIPSKFKVEEMLRRSIGPLESDAGRRASTTARRSFFRRKKHRDSKELASFSNTELGCWSDSGTLADDAPVLCYQRVERLHYGSHRPVVVLGPLRECVAAKLVSDWAHVFGAVRAAPLSLRGAAPALQRGTHLEPRPRAHSGYLDCIPLQAIQELAHKNIHCILDISVATIEKLHKQQVYPIVLFIKFKSFKQIKEMKDPSYPTEKVSAKAAKEMYEHGLKIENEYRSYISAEIPAGVNIAYICTQIKEAVKEEQNKTLWVPSVQA
ncbi:disks large homolog 5 [Plodia interpunctella]|uniref:disks large homolog 5 n=1 Tax=Plodia interpunctella TaxID=58824 RepID=UPI0023684529|nr:disks large homolog 5 [Plodia interpunctella]